MSKGNEEVLKTLIIQSDIDVNVRNDQRQTALHFAAWEDEESIIRWLLWKGAEVDAVDERGETALR